MLVYLCVLTCSFNIAKFRYKVDSKFTGNIILIWKKGDMEKKERFFHIVSNVWLWAQFLWHYCWNSPYLRFLNVGFVNLVFLLTIGVVFDWWLKGALPTFLIALIVSIVHLTFSFISRKIFIYKTQGNWLKEYGRCVMIYSGSILIYALLMWLFVDGFHIYFFVAQILALLSGNLYYTFASYFYFMPKPDLSAETGDFDGLHRPETQELSKQSRVPNLSEKRKEIEVRDQQKNDTIPREKHVKQNRKILSKGFHPFVFVREQKNLLLKAFEEFKKTKIKQEKK